MKHSIHLIVISAIIAIVTSTAHWWFFLLFFLFIAYNWRRSPLPIVLSSCLAFVFFHFYTPIYEQLHSTSLSPHLSEFDGTIVSQPDINGDLLSYRLKLTNGEQVQFRYRIQSEKEQKEFSSLSAGWRCRFSGTLEKPAQARNFYSFDYRGFLKSYYGIHWVVKPVQFGLEQCKYEDTILNRLYRYRNEQMNRIKTDFPEETAGMIIALVFGDRNGIDEQLINQYQSLGLIHLLAVSGLHVGSILGLIYLVLIRLGMTKENGLWVLLGIIPIIIVLTGAGPSVLRAGFMAAMVCIFSLARVKIPVINQLCIVCLMLLLIKPNYIFHLGFQLSFLITFSLILSNKIILKYESSMGKLAAASIIAQIASIPIVLWNFFQFSLWSLPLNMVFIPLVTILVLPLAFLTFLLYCWIPIPVWHLGSEALQVIFAILHKVMDIFYTLPLGSLTFGRPSVIGMIILSEVLLWLLIRWESIVTFRGLIIPTLAVLITFSLLWVQPFFDRNAYITMLDVGQGDAIVIELPYRKGVYVVDTGGYIEFEKEEWRERRTTFDTGMDIVVPYLKARGIREIDQLILTHGDADHIGGALGVIDSIRVESVLYGKSNVYDPSEGRLIEQIRKKGLPVQLVQQGMSWMEGGHRMSILGPSDSNQERNNRSILLYFNLYRTSFLLTGDLEEEKEMQLIRSFPNLNADVLKIAHHGSDTSTSEAFLEQIDPKVALISVGIDNRYNHPSDEVIERLEKKEIKVYRTDQVGAVRLKVMPDGTDIISVLGLEGEKE